MHEAFFTTVMCVLRYNVFVVQKDIIHKDIKLRGKSYFGGFNPSARVYRIFGGISGINTSHRTTDMCQCFIFRLPVELFNL